MEGPPGKEGTWAKHRNRAGRALATLWEGQGKAGFVRGALRGSAFGFTPTPSLSVYVGPIHEKKPRHRRESGSFAFVAGRTRLLALLPRLERGQHRTRQHWVSEDVPRLNVNL
jgi:hypothetical protein